MNISNLLSQRRVWAGLFAAVAFILPLFGIQVSFDQDSWTKAVMSLVEAISGLLAIALPLISYFKPKKS